MEDSELQQSPRKRQKTMDGRSNQSDQGATVPAAMASEPPSAAALPQSSRNEQLSKEAEVGITEFVSPDLPGFSGILKKRYTDFLVNEILPSGQVVHLDNLKLPARRQQEKNRETEIPLSATAGQANSAHSEAFEPVAEPISEPATKFTAEAVSVPTSESAPVPVPEPASGPDPVPGHSDKTGVIQDELRSADPIAKWQAYANGSSAIQLSPEDEALLNSYFGPDVAKATLALYNRILNSPHRKTKEYGMVKSAAINNRELRTNIHQALRRIFKSRLETATDDSGAMVITAASTRSNWGSRSADSAARKQPQQKGKLGWQNLGGEYLHFSLYKENKDTMEVVAFLARQLKMKPQAFQFAGTKDRRGVTVQRVSVYRVYADRLLPLNRFLRDAKIGNYQYQPTGLELGELTGNEFFITLRECQFEGAADLGPEQQVKAASEIVGTAIKHLSDRGYINYYGLQRFGTFSTRTDTIGVKMLQGDFKGAIDGILDYSPAALAAAQDPLSGNGKISSDDKARAHALHTFKSTGKAHPAIDDLPRKFSAEASIIRHLGVSGRSADYLGAMQTIPRNLRLMYVHAYQSLVWNFAASERWKRFGDQVLNGDLVLIDEHKDKNADTLKPEDVDADGEVVVHPAEEDSAASAQDFFTRARALTKEEAESGHYTIFDVVLPTPGYDILYPANEMANFYKTFMASEGGGGLDPQDMRRKWNDVSLSGSYRKLLARPARDISFDIKTYTNDHEQFVQTDVDKMSQGRDDANGHKAEPGAVEDQGSGEIASKIAVILKLQLGSSQYATMALRELMKLGGVTTYKPDFGGGR
ncbi:MAG: pseudouridine synthase Pus7 [Lasallia pustulata]|uniref:Pseudouridine synthase Pus7 n=1 Tax=Lasallia pustulata TaxID=136370 RepID=A0A5M8PRP7_9LECA|nr:MAG: pseudouridine synthase Pus7 [Lasallia pustulata]